MEKRKEMLNDRMTLLNAKEAAQYLRVSLFTLSRMERGGGLVPFRTPGGHRRYSMRMLHEYLENSRNPWHPGGSVTRRQQRMAKTENIEGSQLELVQA